MILMNEKDYLIQVASLFARVEEHLDAFEEELDYDRTSDKLVITGEVSGRKVVLNTQKAIHELWLAGNAQGWHFKFQEDSSTWFAHSEQVEFWQCLSRLIEWLLGKPIRLE